MPATNHALLQSGFRNEPFCDFTDPHQALAMRVALLTAQAELGKTYPLDIPGFSGNAEQIVSINPAQPEQIIGVHEAVAANDVDLAVRAAAAAFPSWSRLEMSDRSVLLQGAAARLRERKFEFSAWLVLEAGKNWAEADADTAEAIDFLEFYAIEALRLANAKPSIQYPGERNNIRYLPLGVGAVIPPWNFPLAIMAGMTCAAIVTGNTVVLKPSPLAPTIAARFYALLQECGMPAGVVTLAQGEAAFGDALIRHPDIAFIAFTGSRKVGMHILTHAAKVLEGQQTIKRTILELGGKDAIIVEADCDLDAAATAVVASAFGFNGQKCSACSRVIIADSIHDAFVDRLRSLTGSLTQGEPAKNASTGPLINQAAYDRLLDFMGQAAQRGTIVIGGKPAAALEQGYYVEPTIVTGLAPDDPICQEEIFGPLLAVLRSRDFDDALRIANDTAYGLTGSVFSNDEAKLDQAAQEFHVGNLYFNRKCTGAMVGAHPFGGFKMSGTDSKAGGSDYLLLFTQQKSIARKLT